MPTKMRCAAEKPDGTRCRAHTLPGKSRCVFHDPASAQKTAAGRRQGGVTRSQPAATLSRDEPDLPLSTVHDVVAALSKTINQVRTGQLAVGVGNCIGCLAGVLLKAMESGDLEQRIAALENPPLRRTA